MMNCMTCGAPLNGQAHCAGCGTMAGAMPVQQPMQQPMMQPQMPMPPPVMAGTTPTTGHNKNVFIIIGVMIAVTIVVVFLILGGGGGNKLTCSSTNESWGTKFHYEYTLTYDKAGEELQTLKAFVSFDADSNEEAKEERDEGKEFCEMLIEEEEGLKCTIGGSGKKVTMTVTIPAKADGAIFDSMLDWRIPEMNKEEARKLLEDSDFTCK